MVLARIGRVIHAVRRVLKGWSQAGDRDYHDSVFAAQEFDPFTFSYAGYVTICRFADLVSPCLDGAVSALDLGCGCGEITCELARRFPGVCFRGVDHSEMAVGRARGHAARLGLPNVAFDVADVERYTPGGAVDIILMFDAFHHLSDPVRFVRRVSPLTKRFALIEPRGDWKGTWQKDIDFDWIVTELEKIRQRMAYTTREPAPAAPPSLPASPPVRGAAIEHRYCHADFKSFFEGMALEVRGTVAGLEVYPPDPNRPSPSRERFGRLTYDLLKEADDLLFERGIDLLAKHWLVVADHGSGRRFVRLPVAVDEPAAHDTVQGPYDVEYVSYDGPRTGPPGTEVHAVVRLRNRSWRVWSSEDPKNAIHLSYHWLDPHGVMIVEDGFRNRLPRGILPGEECACECVLRTPPQPGRYLLAIDLVHEGVTWFSQFGSPCHRIRFHTNV